MYSFMIFEHKCATKMTDNRVNLNVFYSLCIASSRPSVLIPLGFSPSVSYHPLCSLSCQDLCQVAGVTVPLSNSCVCALISSHHGKVVQLPCHNSSLFPASGLMGHFYKKGFLSVSPDGCFVLFLKTIYTDFFFFFLLCPPSVQHRISAP